VCFDLPRGVSVGTGVCRKTLDVADALIALPVIVTLVCSAVLVLCIHLPLNVTSSSTMSYTIAENPIQWESAERQDVQRKQVDETSTKLDCSKDNRNESCIQKRAINVK
jgi:hypothetical protein